MSDASAVETGLIIVQNKKEFDAFNEAVKKAFATGGVFVTGLDLEGVDLGRAPGTIEVVSVAMREQVFLLDAHGSDAGAPHIALLQSLISHDNCVTVIHDCRQDCDALFHHFGFVPRQIHDTQRAHFVLTGTNDKNLNDTLEFNGFKVNKARERIDYKKDYAFWSHRPLTKQMIDHAAGDVALLANLAMSQLRRASEHQCEQIRTASRHAREELRSMRTDWIECGINMGEFIGRKGCNLRRIQQKTGCYFYGRGDKRDRERGFLVYYPNEVAKAAALLALGH